MNRQGQLLALRTDGTTELIENSYESIKAAMDATIDFVQVSASIGFFIDDDGLINGRELNIPASILAGIPLYGPVVLTAGEADDEGDTLPPDPVTITRVQSLGARWSHVVVTAVEMGQTVTLRANPHTVPPPQVVSFETWEEMQEWMMRRHEPDNQ